MRHLIVACLLCIGTSALADLTKPVAKAFKGQFVVVSGPVETTGMSEKESIAAIKAARIQAISGESGAWRIEYMAFPKAGAPTMRLAFFQAGQLRADKRLDGIDSKAAVLSGAVDVTQDDGVDAGAYDVRLVIDKGNKSTTVAATKLTLK